MNRLRGVLFSAVLILLFSLQISPLLSTGEYLAVRKTTIPLLAVNEAGRGSVVYVLIEAHYPGKGSVVVEDRGGSIGEDTIVSIRYALVLSALLTGVDYKVMDYKVVFPPGSNIEGTSATLGFALAFGKLLTGRGNLTGIGSTGLISPGLVVGNVSGILAKYEAGVNSGLRLIIGPHTPSMERRPRYAAVDSLLQAYGLAGIPVRLLENASFPSTNHAYDGVFKTSYLYFYERAEGLLGHGCGQYSKQYGKGARELGLAEKHYAEGRYYTAASYAFRSFVDLLTCNLLSGNIGVGEVKAWFHGNLTLYNESLARALDRGGFLSDPSLLDVVLNSYVRFKTALYLYNSFNGSQDYEILATSLGRVITAIHWLNLTSVVRGDRLAPSAKYLDELVNSTIEYFASMNYIGRSVINVFRRASHLSETNMVLEYGYGWYLLNTLINSLRPPIFNLTSGRRTLEALNSTLNTITLLYLFRLGVAPASALTTAELTHDYYIDGEDAAVLAYIIKSEVSTLLFELSFYYSPSYSPGGFEREAGVFPSLPPLQVVLLWVAIAITGVGGFLIGYSLRLLSVHRRRLEHPRPPEPPSFSVEETQKNEAT